MKKFRLWMGVTTKLVVGMAVLAGCTKPNAKSCKGDNHCNDPALPFCDVDGSLSGEPGTCVAPEGCTPGAFESCRDDQAIVCNADATNYDVVQCEHGCSVEAQGCNPCPPGSTECQTHILPKYLPDACEAVASTPSLTISSSTTLDTSSDDTCNAGIVEQANGPQICVAHFGTITVERNQTLRAFGERALALIADDQLLIDGILDVGAGGPGAGFVKSGAIAFPPSGGGGGGFRTAGAPGGSGSLDGGANNGGSAMTDPSLLADLLGGTTADWGALSSSSVPGAAGGAVTLISCRGEVRILGVIDAGGGGGGGGFYSDVFAANNAAAGGGSGGNVVLQGMAVTVTGEVYANGGGGGAGSNGTNTVASGERGSRSATLPALGGMQAGGGAGGAGGTGSSPPQPGKKGVTASGTAGGGGGSAGFFQTYTPAGVMPTLTPLAASPAFQPNKSIPTR